MKIANTYSRHTEFRVKMQCFLAFQVQFAYQKFITVIIQSANKWLHKDIFIILWQLDTMSDCNSDTDIKITYAFQ